MKRTISISSSILRHLMESYNVNRATIYRATSYKRNNELSRKIRRSALLAGGIATATLPEIETFWDYDGTMRQYFPNGVMLKAVKRSGTIELHYEDKIVATYDNVLVRQITSIQDEARIAHKPNFKPLPLNN